MRNLKTFESFIALNEIDSKITLFLEKADSTMTDLEDLKRTQDEILNKYDLPLSDIENIKARLNDIANKFNETETTEPVIEDVETIVESVKIDSMEFVSNDGTGNAYALKDNVLYVVAIGSDGNYDDNVASVSVEAFSENEEQAFVDDMIKLFGEDVINAEPIKYFELYK
jgi:hypothetical protein